MKKIKFGSFPLISMPRKDRDCIDKFCIKNYADLITLNSAVQSSSSTVDRYITPYSIYKYFKNPSTREKLSNTDGKGLLKDKAESMSRAFKSLRELSIGIQNIPFYSDKVAFPIYLEHKSKASNDYDYDFILLTNDLVDKQILDEIHYDDNVTMMFLVMKDIMYRYVSLSEIGVDSQASENNVKQHFAQFLEACQKYERNPIDIYLNIIKLVGATKQKDLRSPGITNMLAKKLSSSINSKLNSLFMLGEIKSADYLLQALNDKAIAEFLDDTSPENTSTQLGAGKSHPNQQNLMNTLTLEKQKLAQQNATTITTQIEREYLLNKTHHYNEILSVVSSLITFNKQSDIIEEVSDGSLKFKILLNSKEGDITVNADAMIDKLRTTYFDGFVKSLIDLANILFHAFETKARTYLPRDVEKYIQNARMKEYDQDVKKTDPNRAAIEKAYKTIDDLNLQISQTTDQNQIAALRSSVESQFAITKQLNNQILLDQIVNNSKDKSTKNETYEARKYRFEENIDMIQGSLVSLLNELEKMIYDESSLTKFIQAYNSKDQVKIDDVLKDFDITLDIIASEIAQSFEDSFRNQVLGLYNYFNIPSTDIELSVFSKLEKSTLLSTDLPSKMKTNLKSMLQAMYREFGTTLSQSKYTYAQGRAERNPIIKQTVNKKKNFKTFIISQKILIDLYDILSYLDGQMYIYGIMKNPPSKVSGDLAKMRLMIDRLRLQENPVFIFNQIDKSVILSSPDVLSLTGTPIFNRVTRDQMQSICYIDYNRDLWNSKDIFNEYFSEKINKSIKDDEDKSQKLGAEIKTLSKNTKMTDNERKDLAKKIAEKRVLDEKILKKKAEKGSDGIHLTTSMNKDFKPSYGMDNQIPAPLNDDDYQIPEQTSYQQQVQQNQYVPNQPQNQAPQQAYNQPISQPVAQPQSQGHMYQGYNPRPQNRPWNNPYKKY